MDTSQQAAWAAEQAVKRDKTRKRRIAQLRRELRELEGPQEERHYVGCERVKAAFAGLPGTGFPQDVPCTCPSDDADV
jgi:hypothetical protein